MKRRGFVGCVLRFVVACSVVVAGGVAAEGPAAACDHECVSWVEVTPHAGYDSAPVRSWPGIPAADSGANVLGRLTRGTVVSLGRTTTSPRRPGKSTPDRWYEVVIDGESIGWMHASVLRRVEGC